MFGLLYGFYCFKMIDVAKGFIMLSAINGERTQHIQNRGAQSEPPELQLGSSSAWPPQSSPKCWTVVKALLCPAQQRAKSPQKERDVYQQLLWALL